MPEHSTSPTVVRVEKVLLYSYVNGALRMTTTEPKCQWKVAWNFDTQIRSIRHRALHLSGNPKRLSQIYLSIHFTNKSPNIRTPCYKTGIKETCKSFLER